MRRKQSRESLEARVHELEQAHDLYMLATQYLVRNECKFICSWHEDMGTWYQYRVCGETRADGGVVVITFHCDGQLAQTRVAYIEHEYQSAAGIGHASTSAFKHYEAMEKVLRHRNKCIQGQENAIQANTQEVVS